MDEIHPPPIPHSIKIEMDVGGPLRSKDGMAADQDAALASLDPRSQARDVGSGEMQRMGNRSAAVTNAEPGDVPNEGIRISRDWKLERE